jgi:archaellum component FlaC
MNMRQYKEIKIQSKDDNRDEILIEDKCACDFMNLMNDLKNIGKQISTIKEKVEELKKDRLFTRKQQMRILR